MTERELTFAEEEIKETGENKKGAKHTMKKIRAALFTGCGWIAQVVLQPL
jgi:hypothetical protein